MDRVEVFKDVSGLWRFRIVSNNNQIVAHSEGYTRKHNAINGIKTIERIIMGILIPEDIKVVE